MRRQGISRLFAAGLAGLLLAAGPARAIVINDLDGLAAAETLGDPFGAVARITFDNGDGTLGLCSGSLISATAVLTADHCARGYAAGDVDVEFRAGGGSLEARLGVSAVNLLDPDSSSRETLLNGADLAVLELAAPVTDRDPFLLHGGDATGERARAVGYGLNATGEAGVDPQVNSADLVRRAADNLIDAYGPAPVPSRRSNLAGPGKYVAGSANIYSADFDSPAGDANTLAHMGSLAEMIDFEGVIAPGDSGGPLLIRRAVGWMIAGVASGLRSLSDPLSDYGDVGYWTGVNGAEAAAFLSGFEGVTYSDGTVRAVPLPAAGALLLAALAAAAGLAARRS